MAGHIKDYDNVTLMECILPWKLYSVSSPMMFKAHLMELVEKLKETSSRNRNFPSSSVLIMLSLVFLYLHMDTVDRFGSRNVR